MLGERVTVGKVVTVGITDVEGDDEATTDGINEGEGLDATEGFSEGVSVGASDGITSDILSADMPLLLRA